MNRVRHAGRTALWNCLLFIMFAFVAVMAASPTASYPPEVAKALDETGDNRGELQKVLSHYEAEGDSLKLQAAYFLIGNMEGHSYLTYYLKDSAGSEIGFSALDYPDYDSLKTAFGALESRHGTLDFEKKEALDDLKAIKVDFLVKQIDFAFRAWREKPWARTLTFEQFCEYVLPYRGSNEPLEDWRKIFWEKYRDLPSKMADSTSTLEAAKLINRDVESWFKFDPRYYYHPTDQGIAEMLKIGKGRCEDMTNITIYAMRANGLAVTSDYTPYWANAGNNHAWNAILMPDGRVAPFMGAEADPGEYNLANKYAKVYRKTFSRQTGNLVFQQRKQETIPGWLKGKNYKDVTTEYEAVCDVAVRLTSEIPDSVDIAYLCVFNDGEWKPIHWGRIEAAKVTFSDMGKEIAYLPAFYLNEKIEPAGAPFILNADCTIRILQPTEQTRSSLQLTSTVARKQEVSTDGVAKSFLTAGTEYELFYWSDGWQSAGKSVATDKPLVIGGIPAGCLYWLVAKNSDRDERIFTVENGEQVWW